MVIFWGNWFSYHHENCPKKMTGTDSLIITYLSDIIYFYNKHILLLKNLTQERFHSKGWGTLRLNLDTSKLMCLNLVC